MTAGSQGRRPVACRTSSAALAARLPASDRGLGNFAARGRSVVMPYRAGDASPDTSGPIPAANRGQLAGPDLAGQQGSLAPASTAVPGAGSPLQA